MNQNKRIARNWLDYISAGDIEAICRITAPAWRMHGGLRGLPPGSEGVRKLFASFGPVRQNWSVEEVIAEGNKVVTHATNHCRQESFLGIPAKGRAQVFSATFIHIISDGLIMETWRHADDLNRLLQLGVKFVPEKEEDTKQLVRDIFSDTMKSLQKIRQY